MSQETQQNAPVGTPGAYVRQIIAKAERLCRTVASRELGQTPLYLLPQSQLQVGLGTKYHYGFTHPHADLLYRHYINPWLGRGPCAVINDIAIAEDYADEDFEYFIHCLALHELGHILDRHELYDNEDCDDPNRLQFDAMVLSDVSQRPGRSDLPLYYGHGLSYIRLVIHLAHRSTLAGFEVKPAGIFAAHRLGLSPIGFYEDALGDEPHRHLETPLSGLLAIAPDVEFTQQWSADMDRYDSRFPTPKEPSV
jgi:hypothetical protein